MKKILAVILSVAMLFGVLAVNTFADDTATPKVSIVTNQGAPVEKGTTTYFTVRFDNFSTIKGIDVEIKVDQKLTLNSVETSGFPTAEDNENYTKSITDTGCSVRFVDLTNATKNARLNFSVTVPADYSASADPKITVSGKYADSGKTLFDIETPAAGTFEIKREITATEVGSSNTVTAPADKFIPYGGVYKQDGNNITYADKNADGSFSVSESGYVYQSYDVPENKITTFGASDDLTVTDAIKFGSYSELYSADAEHGTMVIEGDWNALSNYYIKRGYTVQQFIKSLYNKTKAILAENENADYVYYTLGSETINVYLFAQNKYMWRNESTGILEYAVRLHGIQNDQTYTAVAYAEKDNTLTISNEVKSVTK